MTYQDPANLPPESQEALRTAILHTDTPTDWYDDLAWIMMQESSGIVGNRNPASSAVGLFQLEDMNYDLMPHGKDSIGHAVDECIGGINYVKQRYGTAKSAKQYWMEHHWY
jgi:SLT domain-containing protein